VTVRTQGPMWWRKLMDRHEIALFRRVEHVELTGKKIVPAHLGQVARFKSLRTLQISSTSLGRETVQEWQQNHPQVEVTYYAEPMTEPVKLSVL
jgi:hypothetical protein